MEKGEIWLVRLPEAYGHEQLGTRSAIVISDTKTPICIVIPLTSNIQALRFGYAISIKPSLNNGLKEESVAMVFQIRAIDKSRLDKKLGKLEDINTQKIDHILKTLLNL